MHEESVRNYPSIKAKYEKKTLLKCVIIFLFPSVRFGSSLRSIELPIELITHTVLHELANKCPNLTDMLLDFSTAMQMHDFNELQVRCLVLSVIRHGRLMMT